MRTFGLEPVVAVNRFPDDDEDIWVEKYDKERVVSLPADGNIEEAA